MSPAERSTMLVACSTFPFQGLPLDQALVRMGELGFRYAEVTIAHQPGWGHMTPEQVRDEPVAALEIMEGAMDRSRVRIASFNIETKPFDLSERGQIEAVCRLARRAGVGHVNVMRAGTKDDSLDLRRLRDFNHLAGDFGITMSVEPAPNPPHGPEEAAEIFPAEGLRVTLDVGVLLNAGMPQETWEPLYPIVGHVHLVDTGGTEDLRQMPWGTGILKLPPIIAGLRAAGYQGLLAIEYLSPSPRDRHPFDPEPELVRARKAVEEELAYPG